MITEIAIASGLFLGCLARALLPFLKKQAEAGERGEVIRWEKRYTWTIVLAVVVSMVAAVLIFPTIDIPNSNVFPLTFAIGWGSTDMLNTLVK
jgi:hypothetical protein